LKFSAARRSTSFFSPGFFDPLGMVDTGFFVPEESRDRLVAYYAGTDPLDPMKPGLTRTDHAPYPGAYLRPVPRLNGGAGLVSTLPDMVALIRSLLPGGPTLLNPTPSRLMMTNQLPAGRMDALSGRGELRGRGHGLAGGVIVQPSSLDHKDASGELFWGGMAGTQWWISPKAKVAGVMMTQRQEAFSHPFAAEFKRLAYRGGAELSSQGLSS
jgi:CubicO group peptidase (beta-lactamase class C family)